jgi:hypothetical protein
MPITTEKIEEAFGYPLLTNAQHEFMTNCLRHDVLKPWYYAIKTDDTKKQLLDAISPFYDKVFRHGCLFHFTLERVQDALLTGVWLEPREDSSKAYGQEALALLAERCKEELTSKYLYDCPSKRMTLEDATTLLQVVHLAIDIDKGLCEAFGLPYIDKNLGSLPDIVIKQINFLSKLESETP